MVENGLQASCRAHADPLIPRRIANGGKLIAAEVKRAYHGS